VTSDFKESMQFSPGINQWNVERIQFSPGINQWKNKHVRHSPSR